MSQPAASERNYTLTIRSEMDPVAPGISAYMSVIRIHGSSGHALMFINRHGGDLADRPVGIFGTTLPDDQATAIATAIDGLKWGELPKPTGGDVGAAMISIDYAHGTRIIQRSFNARNGAFLQAIAPVMSQVDALGPILLAKPLRAIEVAVARTAQGFKLIIRNIGTGPILLADARQVARAGHVSRGTVSFAEKEDAAPGVFAVPPTFKPIALQPLGGAPASVTLAPGQTHEVETVAWTPPKPGTYFARAAWQDYVGPDYDPKTVMPLIPDPEHASDARPYVIRGAAFSKAIKFVVDRSNR